MTYIIYDALRGSYNAIWCIPYVWKWRSSSKFKIISYFGTLTMRLEKRDQPHILSNYFCMHNLNCQNIYDRMKTFRSSIILLRSFRFNLCASQKWFILGIMICSSNSNYRIDQKHIVCSPTLLIFFTTFFQAKQRASIKWLLSKAYNHKTPEELREPFYKDNDVS